MNAQNAPALFASVRTSRDLTLAAFAGALLVAFALQAGAFLPKLHEEPRGAPSARAASMTASNERPARRPPPAIRAFDRARAEPCPAPRG